MLFCTDFSATSVHHSGSACASPLGLQGIQAEKTKSRLFCIFTAKSFLLVLTQVLSSLGWEVISISGTKLSGTPSITACKFYLDCNMEYAIQKLGSEVSSNEENIIQCRKYISLQLCKSDIFPFVQHE